VLYKEHEFLDVTVPGPVLTSQNEQIIADILRYGQLIA